MIQCQKKRCRQRYIGVTQRVKEHIGYVKNKTIYEATCENFNLPVHSYTDMKFTILEQVM